MRHASNVNQEGKTKLCLETVQLNEAEPVLTSHARRQELHISSRDVQS